MMTDAVDMAVEIEGEHLARGIAAAGVPLRAGAAGECEGCEYWMPRLVDGLCGFCRDGRRRPDDWEPPVRPDFTDKPAAIVPLEERPMPAKSITLPASAEEAIAAIVARATANDISQGQAAAELIEHGADVLSRAENEAAPAVATMSPRQRMVALLDGVSELLIEQIEAAQVPREDPALSAERDIWKSRAEIAEERLEAIKKAFAA